MSDQFIYKKKYEALKHRIRDLAEEIELKTSYFKPSTSRAFMQSRRVYVNFDYEVCDTLEFAENNWGEGSFDVYDLNLELSPFDQESHDHFTGNSP